MTGTPKMSRSRIRKADHLRPLVEVVPLYAHSSYFSTGLPWMLPIHSLITVRLVRLQRPCWPRMPTALTHSTSWGTTSSLSPTGLYLRAVRLKKRPIGVLERYIFKRRTIQLITSKRPMCLSLVKKCSLALNIWHLNFKTRLMVCIARTCKATKLNCKIVQ